MRSRHSGMKVSYKKLSCLSIRTGCSSSSVLGNAGAPGDVTPSLKRPCLYVYSSQWFGEGRQREKGCEAQKGKGEFGQGGSEGDGNQ